MWGSNFTSTSLLQTSEQLYCGVNIAYQQTWLRNCMLRTLMFTPACGGGILYSGGSPPVLCSQDARESHQAGDARSWG